MKSESQFKGNIYQRINNMIYIKIHKDSNKEFQQRISNKEFETKVLKRIQTKDLKIRGFENVDKTIHNSEDHLRKGI